MPYAVYRILAIYTLQRIIETIFHDLKPVQCSLVVLGYYPSLTPPRTHSGESYPARMKHLTLLLVLLITGCQSIPEYPKGLEALNKHINAQITYVADPPGRDFWQKPEETEGLGTGDCEDYAILKSKYVGYPSRLVIVQIPDGPQHAILQVDVHGTRWFLDNRYDLVLSEKQKRNLYGPDLVNIEIGFPDYKRD